MLVAVLQVEYVYLSHFLRSILALLLVTPLLPTRCWFSVLKKLCPRISVFFLRLLQMSVRRESLHLWEENTACSALLSPSPSLSTSPSLSASSPPPSVWRESLRVWEVTPPALFPAQLCTLHTMKCFDEFLVSLKLYQCIGWLGSICYSSVGYVC